MKKGRKKWLTVVLTALLAALGAVADTGVLGDPARDVVRAVVAPVQAAVVK